MKYKDWIYYYDHPEKFTRGGFGARIYIIKGSEGSVMIETATNGRKLNNEIRKSMEKEGIKLSDIRFILLTHSHPDHCRGTPYWTSAIAEARGSEPDVMVHNLGVKYVEDSINYNNAIVETLGRWFYQITYIPWKITETLTDYLWGGRFTYDRVVGVEDGFTADLGDIALRVHHTPGHSPDHCVIELTRKEGDHKYLISGDLISLKDMGKDIGIQPLASFNNPLSSLKDELDSLLKVKKISPVVLLTMHYGIIEGKERIRDYLVRAYEEGKMLKEKTIKIISEEEGIKFRKLVKKVIDMPNYLSGISTRENSVFVIVRELMEEGIVEEIPGSEFRFRLIKK